MIHSHEGSSYLQRTPVRSDDPLPPLHKPFLIRNDVPDLDDVACNGIVQNLDRLGDVNASSEQFDQVAGFEYNVRIIGFAGCPHRHGTTNQVEGACNSLSGVSVC